MAPASTKASRTACEGERESGRRGVGAVKLAVARRCDASDDGSGRFEIGLDVVKVVAPGKERQKAGYRHPSELGTLVTVTVTPAQAAGPRQMSTRPGGAV